MKVDKETVKKIAHLARLDFNEKDGEALVASMTEILDWVEKLNELDTEGVEPLLSMSREVNSFRDDKTEPPLDHERAMKNAPKKDDDYFRVPKVLKS